MRKNLWGIVKPMDDGEGGTSTRALTVTNIGKDEQALGIIITALDDNYIHYIDDCSTATKAWETLERLFGARAKHSKISLKMQLYGLTKEPNESVAMVINRLKSLMTQLAYVQAPVPDEDAVAILLKAMAPEFDQIVTVLKEKEPIPSLESVINSLQEEERKISKLFHEGAYAVPYNNKKKCATCGRTNHLTKDCFSSNPCPHCGKTNHPPSKCYQRNKKIEKANVVEEAHIETVNVVEVDTVNDVDEEWAF